MNKALLAKVGWRLIHDDSILWTRVIQSKYKVKGVRDQTWMAAKKPGSSTWRSVRVGLREVIIKGMS